MFRSFPYLFLLISFNSLAFNNLEKALSAYQQQNIETAYIHLKNALQENDENLPAKVLMGRVLLEKGLYRDGIREFDEALILGADPNQFIFEQVRAMLLVGQNQQIIDLLARLKLNQDLKVKTLLIKSNAYIAMDKEALALAPLLEAANLAPNDISVLSSLTNFYINQRKFSDAEQHLTKLLTLASENSRVWNLHASFHSALGNHQKALTSLETAYALVPEDPVIMRALSHKYTNLRMYDKALTLVNEIIEKTPNDPYARLLKSQLLSQNNQLEEAQQILADISAKLSLLTDAQKNSNSSLAYVSGSAAFMQGNLELAQKELTFYVNDNPNDISGLNMLTAIYSQQGQPDKIQELLERNEKIVLRDLGLSLKLFQVYLSSNKTYKAKNILEDLANTYPNNLQIITAQANYLAKSKRYQEAINLLNESQPEQISASYMLNKGLIYLEMGDYSQANFIADELLKVGPNNNSFKNFKGVIYLKSGQWQQAANLFEQILVYSPENYTSTFNLANAYARLNKIPQALALVSNFTDKNYHQAELLLLQAKLQRDNRQLEAAIASVQSILAKDSNDIAAIELLMTLYYQQGQYQPALELVNKLNNMMFLEPKHLIYKANILINQEAFEEARKPLGVLLGLAEQPDDFYQLSLLQEKAHDKQSAYKTIEQAIIKQPNNQLYLLTRAKLAISIKSPQHSQQLIDELNQRFANNPNVKLLQGDLWLKQSNKRKAQQSYSQALALDSRFNQAIAKLYMLANQQVGGESFAKQLELLIKSKQTTAIAQNLLADYYLNNEEQEKAKHHYEALLASSSPNNKLSNKANILNNLANIYLSSDLDKAKSLIDEAVTMQPNSSSFIDTQGWVLSLQGQHTAALQKLRNAYVLNSNNPAISYHIAYTLSKLDRKEEAKTELKKLLAQHNRFTDKAAAEKLLNELNQSS